MARRVHVRSGNIKTANFPSRAAPVATHHRHIRRREEVGRLLLVGWLEPWRLVSVGIEVGERGVKKCGWGLLLLLAWHYRELRFFRNAVDVYAVWFSPVSQVASQVLYVRSQAVVVVCVVSVMLLCIGRLVY